MKSFSPLFAVLLAGCLGADATDLSMQLSETPFRQLPGVALGMTAVRLHQLRPNAKYSPYFGMQEALPGYTVSYQFPSAVSDAKDADVAPLDELEGVFVTEMFDSMETAETKWRETVVALTRRRREPDLCERFSAGGMQARWAAGKTAIAIGAFPREPIAPAIGNRVVYAVSPINTMKQPPGATKMECPKP